MTIVVLPLLLLFFHGLQSVPAGEQRALDALEAGLVAEAVVELRAIVPATRASRLLLAVALAATKEGGAEADRLLAAEASAAPPDVELLLARARVHLRRERIAAALADLDAAAVQQPSGAEIGLVRGLVQAAAGRLSAAEAALAPLVVEPGGAVPGAVDPASDPASPAARHRREALQAMAQLAMRQRRFDEAAALFARLATLRPKAADPMAQAAICHGLRHRYGEAITAWQEAIRRAPSEPEYRFRLADVLRSQGRVGEAIEGYEAMLALGGSEAVARLRLAELSFEAGDAPAARDHFVRAAELAPESGDVAAIGGRIYEKLGELDRAIELDRKAIARNPLRWDALYRLALLLSRSADAAVEAEGAALLERYRRIEPHLADFDALRQELAVDPRNAATLTRLASLLNEASEWSTARAFIARAEAAAPPQAATLLQAGCIAANLGDAATARDRFGRTLELVAADATQTEVAARLRGWLADLERDRPLPLPLVEPPRQRR